MASSSAALKTLAIVLILVTGAIHLLEAQDAFSEVTYKGVLFVANGIGAILAAYGIFKGMGWGWLLGLLVAAGAAVAYVLSRTVGLPSLPAEPDAWFEPLGIASLVCEVLFVLVFAIGRPRMDT